MHDLWTIQVRNARTLTDEQLRQEVADVGDPGISPAWRKACQTVLNEREQQSRKEA